MRRLVGGLLSVLGVGVLTSLALAVWIPAPTLAGPEDTGLDLWLLLQSEAPAPFHPDGMVSVGYHFSRNEYRITFYVIGPDDAQVLEGLTAYTEVAE